MDSQQSVLAARYHVGWPSLPYLPVKLSEREFPPNMVNLREEIHKRVRDALERNRLIEKETTIEFGRRYASVPTVLVRTPWQQSSKIVWKKAVEEMVASVKKDFPAAIDGGLQFEMIAPEVDTKVYISDANGADISWEEIKAVTHRHPAANETTKDKWNLIVFCRRGFSENRSDDPNPLTVHVAFFYKSDETAWDEIIEAIELEFRERGCNELWVHMEHNEQEKK
ncbi:hypothetical protein FLONG3_7253 [Fusarium longipes]|uniref:Uncharacterized protein n=1 Tax=Fusarium longipes TaxID=694270 RepID=A0A395SFZ6_9HYPO|nr:hypothetical protein FLONG3_7253 [Fusarium longipes]